MAERGVFQGEPSLASVCSQRTAWGGMDGGRGKMQPWGIECVTSFVSHCTRIVLWISVPPLKDSAGEAISPCYKRNMGQGAGPTSHREAQRVLTLLLGQLASTRCPLSARSTAS